MEERIEILHQRIKDSFYEEQNYLLCNKLVQKLLEYFPNDEVGLKYAEKLKGIDLDKFKKDWENSQNLGLSKEEEFINTCQTILDTCSFEIRDSFRN